MFKLTFASADPTDLYDFVYKWAIDKVHEQFKVEVEDVNYSIQQLTEEEKDILDEHEEEVRGLMETLFFAADDDNDEDYEDVDDLEEG